MDLLQAQAPAPTNRAPIWTPLPGPQSQAYYSTADEVFYGGAGGGGKSDLLLGLAGTAHWQSVIFRRVFPSVRGLIERSREIFNAAGDAHSRDSYNESLHLWRLTAGRVIEFSSLQYDKDVQDQRGRPRDFYGWDELPEFSEYQFRFVNAWNRSTRPGQRCRVVATGNPPTTQAGQWIIRYWAPWLDPAYPDPAMPGDLRWFARIDNADVPCADGTPIAHKGELVYPKSRTFIPARLEDNPILEATGYRAILQALPEPLRSQMLYGDFTIGTTDDPWQVIPTAWVRAAQARWTAAGAGSHPLTALGVDVARGGADQTVIAARHGAWYAPLRVFPGSSTPDGPRVAAQVLAAHRDKAAVQVDVIGVGGSVYDHLVGVVPAVAVNVASGTAARDRTGRLGFVNVRAELYWKFREALDPDTGDGVALPPDPELLADLTAPRWTLRSNGIQVESKEALRERLGRSPDKGDAVLLASYLPVRREMTAL